jgi:hypothetical protein
MDRELEKVVAQVEREGAEYSDAISRDSLLAWMQSDDVESKGAVHALLALENVRARISPPLQFDDYYRFTSAYFFSCLAENPKGEWAHSRYEAGWDLCRWFMQLWDDHVVDRRLLRDLKDRLAAMYRAANVDLRTAIETAVLEHLFEDPRIAEFFEDWSKEEPLSMAYGAAKLWVDRGGESPLHDSRRAR